MSEADIVQRLRERAKFALEEDTGTAMGDARHFNEAANEIERLRAGPAATPASGDYDFDNLTDLVTRFAAALLEKLKAAEAKYGHNSGWMRDDWQVECQKHLNEHLAKGDPRDVAAYCAFLWHHGWPTIAPTFDRSAVIEECAKVALMYGGTIGGPIAKDIRALSRPDAKPTFDKTGVSGDRTALDAANAAINAAMYKIVGERYAEAFDLLKAATSTAENALAASAPVSRPDAKPTFDITDEMVDRAAREMWNDRDARHGGSWDSRDPNEVCVIQTKATARAALTAALVSRPHSNDIKNKGK